MYFITTFVKLEKDTNGNLDEGSRRTPGYYKERKTAVNALHENYGDIWEMTYNYACIEYIKPGLYQYDINPQFFKWDDTRKGYYEIEKPEITENLCGFAIG